MRNFLAFWGITESQKEFEWQKWYDNQLRSLESGEVIEPPWVAFPDSEPFGWNQGYQEEWKAHVWIPFWDNLTADEKKSYLKHRQPPTEDWQNFYSEYLD